AEKAHEPVPFLICFLQVLNGTIALVKTMSGNGKTRCRHIAPCGERVQLAEPFKRLVALVCPRVRVTQQRQGVTEAGSEASCCAECFDGLRKTSQASISKSDKEMCHQIARVQAGASAQVLYCLLKPVGQVEMLAVIALGHD